MTSRHDVALGTVLERSNSLSSARWAWRAMLAIPLIGFALVVRTLDPSGPVTGPALLLLLVAVLWLALVAPMAILLRSHCFGAAWGGGQPIDPPSYLRGLVTVWLTLEIVAIVSLASCVAADALMPGILPGVLALALLALTGPSGRALQLTDD